LVPVGALLVATGCSVAVPDPAPDDATAAICGTVLADLPRKVLDQSRRTATPGRLSAAWGRPAITLRCGVPKPPSLVPTSACFEVNGVGWYAEEATGGYLFTTIGRPAFVEMAVPSKYAPEAGALVDVAGTINAHDPVQQPCQ
jgi:hypothetical protein